MDSRRPTRPGFLDYSRVPRDDDPLLDDSNGKQKPSQARSGQSLSVFSTLVTVAALLAAVTALIVGSVALRNTDQGLIGRIANLVVGDFYATGNGAIDGSLVVGGGISSRKRAEGEMAVDVNGPSRFDGDVSAATTLTVGDANAGRKRGSEAEKQQQRGNSRGRTRSACKPEKLTVRGSASLCGGIQVNGTANLTDTNVNGTLTVTNLTVLNTATIDRLVVNMNVTALTALTAAVQNLFASVVNTASAVFGLVSATNATITSATVTSATVTNLSTQMSGSVPLTHTTSATVPASHNFQLLNGGASALNMSMPADMTAFIGKRIKVCSVSGWQDSLVLGGTNKFDNDGFWSVWRADANPCCITFDVISATRLDITERKCGVFCTNSSFVHCIDPQRADATNPLHGWWQTSTKNGERINTVAFGYSYRFINMTVSPPIVQLIGGNIYEPRQWSPDELTNVSVTSPARTSGLNFVTMYAISPTLLSMVNSSNIEDPFEATGLIAAPTGEFGEATFIPKYFQLVNNQLRSGSVLRVAGSERLALASKISAESIPPIISLSLGTTTKENPYDPKNILKEQANWLLTNGPGSTVSSKTVFVGSISGTTLTVTTVNGGRIHGQQIIETIGVAAGTRIVRAITGTGLTGTYQVSISQTVSSRPMYAKEPDLLFSGSSNAVAILDKLLTTGYTYSTPILSVAKTVNAVEGLTTFFFQTSPNVEPVGRVSFSGFSGNWSVLNSGVYHVFSPTTTVMLAPDPLFEDYDPINPNKRTVRHSVTIWFDSSAIPDALSGTPSIIATYGPVNAATNYIDTVSCFMFWYHQTFKVGLHFRPTVMADPRTITGPGAIARVNVEWDDITSQIATNTQRFTGQSSRLHNTATLFYTNPVLRVSTSGGVRSSNMQPIDYIGPYNIRPDYFAAADTNPWYYHISRQNYLTDVVYPTFKMIGSTRTHAFNLFARFQYPGGQGDEFDYTLVPYASLPPTQYSFVLFSAPLNGPTLAAPATPVYSAFSSTQIDSLKRNFFFGKVNSSYTGSNTVGYIRLNAMSVRDRFGLMELENGIFRATGTSDVPTLPAPLVQLAAKMMNYLKNTLGCTQIIFDIRGNGGGQSATAFRSVFGTDNDVPLWNFNFLPQMINTDYGFHTYLDADTNGIKKASPALVESIFPNSTFNRGTIVMLTDLHAASFGDVFPNFFLGKNFDKQLGGNTTVKIFGNMDGRLVGASCSNHRSTVSATGPRTFNGVTLRPSSIGPISTFDCGQTPRRADNSSYANRYPYMAIDCPPAWNANSSLSSLPAGLANGCPMVSDWENLVYPDIGVVANTRPIMPGWTGPQTPSVWSVTNVLSTTNASNVVTVTLGPPHGLTSADRISITDVVPTSVSGISSVNLMRNTAITVTGSNTFTFVAGSAASSTASGVGGTFRILVPSQWRDAWLEQSILALKDLPILPPLPPPSKRSVPRAAKEEPRKVHYGREAACGEGAMEISDIHHAEYKPVVVDDELESDASSSAAFIGATYIHNQMISGALCLAADGHLMSTTESLQIPVGVLKSEI